VVWLNELQGFLGLNEHGLSLDVLRDLYAPLSRGEHKSVTSDTHRRSSGGSFWISL
jgi:hypothetical protein